jgi:predicted GIY-YIG superfamily endonuclease
VSKDLARSPARQIVSYYVYIMSSKSGVLYIGATHDLDRRVFEHRQGLIEGFTKKYRVTRLIYVEKFDRPAGWSRAIGSSRDGRGTGSSS